MAAPPLRRGFVLARETPFSYRCQACSRCCRNKGSRVNPYEVARLAEVLGTTTTEVLARWTTEGGSLLAARADGTCVFLGQGGCTVHAGRPLVCRLYPLGRSRDAGGAERFAELEPVADSQGVYGEDGTVDDFLRSQGVGPYLSAADRYVDALGRMLVALAARADVGDLREEATEATRRAPLASDESLLDMDAVVSRWCAERGTAAPSDVEGKTAIHLEALETFAASVASRPA